MKTLTIIMYHYVRPILDSNFPNLKGLEITKFKNQLDYLTENFSFITAEELVYSIKNNSPLPPDACWLTFDDGYADHYKFVFPELLKRGIQGSFFPPTNAIRNQKLLPVNAVHHILARSDDIKFLKHKLNEKCREYKITDQHLNLFWKQFATSNRFDNSETIYVKRMLQHILPEHIRVSITEELFHEFVGTDTSEFAKNLYLSEENIIEMNFAGMHFGSHGTNHYWLDRLDKTEQKIDIQVSLNFLNELGCKMQDWVMCYPYGAFNRETIRVLEELGCLIGVTTQVGVANITDSNLFTLPRFDTNDFPQ